MEDPTPSRTTSGTVNTRSSDVLPTRAGQRTSEGVAQRNRLIRHMIIGGIAGFVGAIALSSVLYMNSVHVVFSWVLVAVLAMMGSALWMQHSIQLASSHSSQITPMMSLVARGGSFITMLSAAAAALIHYEKPEKSALVQTVFLVWLSIGVTYSFGLVLTDQYNRHAKGTRKMFAWQLYTVAGAAVVLGATGAFLFGLVDVEDHVRRFGYEQWITAVVGFVAGLLIAHANFHATDDSMQIQFDPITMEDVDEEE